MGGSGRRPRPRPHPCCCLAPRLGAPRDARDQDEAEKLDNPIFLQDKKGRRVVRACLFILSPPTLIWLVVS